MKKKDVVIEENNENKEIVKTKKKANLPNIMTVIRIIMVPIFVVTMVFDAAWEYMRYVSLGLFVLASITDYLDGIIARKKGLVTRFGKLMDPLADKILVAAGFIMLTGMDIIPAWVTVIVVVRDFLLNTLRMFGTEAGETIAAGMSGKVKTAFQMLAIILGLVDKSGLFQFVKTGHLMGFSELLLNVGFTLSLTFAVIFTLWSCIEYLVKYRKYIDITE